METKKGLAIGLGLASAAAFALYLMKGAHAAPPPEPPEPGMAKLYGRVTNSSTGNGIAGVRVTTTGAITETDSAGNYATLDIPPGDWGVRFEKDGYETKELTVSIQEGNNEFNVQLVPTGAPGGSVEITGTTVDPTQLTSARHEYETSLGLGYWGDPFTIRITYSNPFDYDVWVKPDYALGQLTGQPLQFVSGALQGFNAESLLYFRLLLNTAGYQGDYSYTTNWQKPWDAKGQNVSSGLAFVYDPDGVPRMGDERWLKVPAGGSVTTTKEAHLGTDASLLATALQCTTCGAIITGTENMEQHYADNHPGKEVTCWVWEGFSGCYFNDDNTAAAWAVYIYVPAEGVAGLHDLCVVAWRAIYFVYDPGCGQTRVGGQIVTINWRLEELDPIASAVPNLIEIVPG